MRNVCLAMLVTLAACAGDTGQNNPDANPTNDSGAPSCNIVFDPQAPVASPVTPIRATASLLGVSGVVGYSWDVRFYSTNAAVAFSNAAADGSAINFFAATPGAYIVKAQITGTTSCPSNTIEGFVNVTDPNANMSVYRLHAVPSNTLAPPQDTIIQVNGGADIIRQIALDPGFAVPGTVRDNTGAGIQAYLKFMPVATPNAYSELFSAPTGGYSVRLLGVDHKVLVVPAVAGLAPKLIDWNVGTTTLDVGPGTLVTGTVRGPGGGGLAGAKVQLYAGIVPSTLATTDGTGAFSLRADFPAGAMITAKVTPPATSGLPRLEGTAAFTLATLNISYSNALATCDLANATVRRGGTAQGGAKVTIVGTTAGGSIAAGTTISVSGTVRVTATANGSGQLPSTLVPRAPLSAVSEISMLDRAVSALDTSACPAAPTINAPAQVNIPGVARDSLAQTLSGVRVEAWPTGALAQAGTQPVQATSSGSGAFNLLLASGASYDIRFVDPFARAAPLTLLNQAASGSIIATLPKSLKISGDVSVLNSSNPVIGASIQILCASCTGLDAARPIAETATDAASHYSIAVPDPGTM